jgi:glyoxylase-like metal-dependent hydrolase (beta-lactamase superfamily II)
MTRIEVPGHDLIGIRAANPGPFTLTGTNSWIVGRDPAWLVDPGPDLDDHIAALIAELDQRGGLGGVATPGHAPDHLAYITGTAALTGDAVLGEGSVFVAPDPGALAGYLEALIRLRERPLTVLLPGHGPPVSDPQAKLDEYVSHRLDRETRLVLALEAGKRTTNDLLDDVWSDVPAGLRPAAAVTLAAHLDKLSDEGRLPAGVERPAIDLSGHSV